MDPSIGASEHDQERLRADEEFFRNLPQTCQECGCDCSTTERNICLGELDGEDS